MEFNVYYSVFVSSVNRFMQFILDELNHQEEAVRLLERQRINLVLDDFKPTYKYQKPDLDKGEDKCVICFEDCEVGEEVRELVCKHVFHAACIADWLVTETTCPLCRQPSLRIIPMASYEFLASFLPSAGRRIRIYRSNEDSWELVVAAERNCFTGTMVCRRTDVSSDE